MLQIILFILKILGWILLTVLGLLVLVFLLVLFTPLRYQVEARCKGKLSTLEAGVRFHIFFHLVSGDLRYQEQKLTWKIRAAWIKLGNGGETADLEETEEKDAEQTSPVNEKLEETAAEPLVTVRQGTEETGTEKKHPIEEEPKDPPAKDPDPVKESEEAGDGPQEKINTEPENTKSSGTEFWSDKIASVFEKIKYTFSLICDKIEALWKKVEEIKAFLVNGTHQSSFWKLVAELKKLLFRMRPKQVDGNLEFGFEDPSLTGRVLAGLSMVYPYWEVRLYPDFERKVLDGSISVKGAARLWPAAVLVWNLLWDRDVRRTVLDIKKMVFNKK